MLRSGSLLFPSGGALGPCGLLKVDQLAGQGTSPAPHSPAKDSLPCSRSKRTEPHNSQPLALNWIFCDEPRTWAPPTASTPSREPQNWHVMMRCSRSLPSAAVFALLASPGNLTHPCCIYKPCRSIERLVTARLRNSISASKLLLQPLTERNGH